LEISLPVTFGRWAGSGDRGRVATREKVAMLSHHWVCDSSRTRQDLGWEPEVRFPDGLKITAQWYEENGWL